MKDTLKISIVIFLIIVGASSCKKEDSNVENVKEELPKELSAYVSESAGAATEDIVYDSKSKMISIKNTIKSVHIDTLKKRYEIFKDNSSDINTDK